MFKKVVVLSILSALYTYASEGILQIKSNFDNALVYNGNKKIAILENGKLELKLKEGTYKLTLVKEISEEKEYASTKKIKIESNTTSIVKFKLIKKLSRSALKKEKKRFKKLRFKDNGTYILPPMIKVRGGTYTKGSELYTSTKPIQKIKIKKTFYVSKYEVTFNEFDKFTKDTKRKRAKDNGFGRGLRPVTNISWNDAQDYVLWLSKKTGRTYTLPSENQWEYVARTKRKTLWHFGQNAKNLPKYAWYDINSATLGSEHEDYGMHPVAQKRANKWGVYDMYGNVREFCSDWYVPNYKLTPKDENKNEAGRKLNKVVRGGSWNDSMDFVNSSYRSSFGINARSSKIGFRIIRTIK